MAKDSFKSHLTARLRELSQDGVEYANELHSCAMGTGSWEGAPANVRANALALVTAYVAGKPVDRVEVSSGDAKLDGQSDEVLERMQRQLEQQIAVAKAGNRIANIEPTFMDEEQGK